MLFRSDDEKALHYANMGGSLHCTKEVLVSFAQEGEEGIAATQEYIRSMLERVAFSAGCDLLRKGDYSTEERIHVYEFCIKLLKLPVSEEDAKLYADNVARFYQMIAWQICIWRKCGEDPGSPGKYDKICRHRVRGWRGKL